MLGSDARVRAWIAVPCERPLVHGGGPPPKENQDSHVLKPPRGEPIARSSLQSSLSAAPDERIAISSLKSCFRPSRSHAVGSRRQAVIRPFAIPKFASGWSWRPLPG